MTTTPRKSNDVQPSIKLYEIATLLGGELVGDRNLQITGVAGIKDAEKGDITFLSNAKYLPFLFSTKASAVVVDLDIDTKDLPAIRVSNPSSAFTKIVTYFTPAQPPAIIGVHPTAVIAEDVHLGDRVSVGAQCVIERNSKIGGGTVVGAQCFIGHDAHLGKNCFIHPHVTIREGVHIGDGVIIHSGSVIGSDGFGYEAADGKHIKIPQLGSVVIEDDVEIGANVCVDRGRFKNTHIGKGTKIDNLVQIAHNVVIGENCLVVSQAGISGSTVLGDRVIIAGQVGLVGHIEVGDDVIVAARSGVTKSVPAKSILLGEPAKPMQEQKKIFALISRLPELFKDLADIKKKLS
jgi:UDP-3-O-[3-hydroxymyristoyl] glucosamine N-acyltransferase